MLSLPAQHPLWARKEPGPFFKLLAATKYFEPIPAGGIILPTMKTNEILRLRAQEKLTSFADYAFGFISCFGTRRTHKQRYLRNEQKRIARADKLYELRLRLRDPRAVDPLHPQFAATHFAHFANHAACSEIGQLLQQFEQIEARHNIRICLGTFSEAISRLEYANNAEYRAFKSTKNYEEIFKRLHQMSSRPESGTSFNHWHFSDALLTGSPGLQSFVQQLLTHQECEILLDYAAQKWRGDEDPSKAHLHKTLIELVAASPAFDPFSDFTAENCFELDWCDHYHYSLSKVLEGSFKTIDHDPEKIAYLKQALHAIREKRSLEASQADTFAPKAKARSI